ncbi:MAG: GNAT family N-acetyltransferase [Anaerolineae bacterium]|nr:GNAT family N-acetyltransferase [Anaerolineae bacterium]
MTVQLKEQNYERVRPVFEGLRYNLVVDSVIDGNTPAWVFADNAEKPTTALIWNRQDAILVAGDAENHSFNQEIKDIIADTIIPNAKKRYIPELSLHYAPDSWQAKINIILQGKNAQLAGRRYYKIDHLNMDWQAGLPIGCVMRPINEALLESNDFENVRHVAGWVSSYWRSYRDFERTSFGYCLLKDGVIASWCLAVYVSGKHYELGLATIPDYRRKGYATLVAAASVEYCQTEGYTPHWHCWEENAASIATAAKVGFTHPQYYTVYRFDI